MVRFFLASKRWRSVSEFVDSHFASFHSGSKARQAAKKLKQTTGQRVPSAKIAEQWAVDGQRAAQKSLFIRSQIISFLRQQHYSTSFNFIFNGKYASYDETIDVGRQMQFFRNFIADEKISASDILKVDFPVISHCDRLRGRVTLLCKNDSGVAIYSFSSSNKLGYELDGQFVPSTDNPTSQMGYRAMAAVQDTKYNRECFKMNIYRSILERHYAITVSSATIVAIGDSYNSYHRLDIPLRACGEN